MSRSTVLALAIAVATTSAFACGPSPKPTDPSATGTPPTDGTSTPTADPTAGGGAEAPAPSPTGTDPAPAPKPAKVEAVPITPSKMVADLKKLGIDPNKYPDLAKIPLAKKKKLMPLFQKALGMDSCEGCHAEGDFKKETKNIKMARGMWKHYVQALKIDAKVVKGGGALFCDSCHNGKTHVLPRHDDEALNNFMTVEYEGKLARVDGKEHACATCHGAEMEYAIFKNMWGIK